MSEEPWTSCLNKETLSVDFTKEVSDSIAWRLDANMRKMRKGKLLVKLKSADCGSDAWEVMVLKKRFSM